MSVYTLNACGFNPADCFKKRWKWTYCVPSTKLLFDVAVPRKTCRKCESFNQECSESLRSVFSVSEWSSRSLLWENVALALEYLIIKLQMKPRLVFTSVYELTLPLTETGLYLFSQMSQLQSRVWCILQDWHHPPVMSVWETWLVHSCFKTINQSEETSWQACPTQLLPMEKWTFLISWN